LRILRMLQEEELSVGELARALQLPQSTVSRHLKLLHDDAWVTKRTVGTASLYRMVVDTLEPTARELWSLTRSHLGMTHTMEEDDARLAEVLAERREESASFFGRVGAEWDHLRRDLFGEHFTTEATLALLSRDWVIADIGCGTGNIAELLAPFVKRVIAIDREPAMLDASRKRLSNLDNIEFRQGDIIKLPLEDAAIDAALISLVLHHLDNPANALREVAADGAAGRTDPHRGHGRP
jgi:SAM-dependent methyltransferase